MGASTLTTQPDEPSIESTVARPTLFPIVGVGASAGGLEAFTQLLRHIPADAGWRSSSSSTSIRRTRASSARRSRAATTHPGARDRGRHARRAEPRLRHPARRGRRDPRRRADAVAAADGGAHGRTCPIDFFFRRSPPTAAARRSASCCRAPASDGTEGLRAIKAEDGITFAQDPRVGEVRRHARGAVETGVVDFALPFPSSRRSSCASAAIPSCARSDAEALATPGGRRASSRSPRAGAQRGRRRLQRVQARDHPRRLARRMALRRADDARGLPAPPADDPAEAQALYEDILIHVTSFFRDPEAFEELKEHVFPAILKQKRDGGTDPHLVGGCSTGEEVYSLAIALLEFLAQQDASDVPVQIFGTDISEQAIEKARAGFYPDGALRDVSAERLARFFTKVDAAATASTSPCATVRVRAARPRPRSAVLEAGSRELPQRPHLLRSGAAEAGARHVPLRAEPARLSAARPRGEHRRRARTCSRSIDKEQQDLRADRGPSTLALRSRRETRSGRRADRASRARRAARRRRSTQPSACCSTATRRPASSSTSGWRSSSSAGGPGRTSSPRPESRSTTCSRWRARGCVADLRIAHLAGEEGHGPPCAGPGVRVEQDGVDALCDLVVVPFASPPGVARGRRSSCCSRRRAAPSRTREAARPAEPEPPLRARRGTERTLAKLEDELKATKDYLQSLIEEHERTNEELRRPTRSSSPATRSSRA